MLKNINMTNEEVRNQLFSLKDEKYKNFHSKLIPNISKDKVIGVRVPIVRNLAKKLAKDSEYILSITNNSIQNYLYYHEEIMLYGLVIGYLKVDINAKLNYFDNFLPYACSWSITDTVFQGITDFTKEENRKAVFDYFSSKAFNKEEYICRSSVVVLFRYFLTDDYITEVIAILTTIKSDKYYINMAVSWAIAEILAKYYEKGKSILKSEKLSDFVQNMAIKKAQESYKISKENKLALLKYKR